MLRRRRRAEEVGRRTAIADVLRRSPITDQSGYRAAPVTVVVVRYPFFFYFNLKNYKPFVVFVSRCRRRRRCASPRQIRVCPRNIVVVVVVGSQRGERDVVARFVPSGPQPPRRTVGRRTGRGPPVGARVRQARHGRAQLLPGQAIVVGRPSGLVLFVRVRLVGRRAQAKRGPRAQEGVRPAGSDAQSILYATVQSTYPQRTS